MTWIENTGRAPRTSDALLQLRWKSGNVSAHHYTASQVRWSQTGHEFDVAAYRKVAE